MKKMIGTFIAAAIMLSGTSTLAASNEGNGNSTNGNGNHYGSHNQEKNHHNTTTIIDIDMGGFPSYGTGSSFNIGQIGTNIGEVNFNIENSTINIFSQQAIGEDINQVMFSNISFP